MKKFTQEQLKQLPEEFKGKFPISDGQINSKASNPLSIKEYEALFTIDFEDLLKLSQNIVEYQKAILKMASIIDKYPKAISNFLISRNSGELNLKLKNSSEQGIKNAKKEQLKKIKDNVSKSFEE